MSTIHGSEGVVKIGSNTLAEVTGFSVDEQAEFADNTPLNATAQTSHETAITSWSASLECMLDETDSTGQQALTAGATVTLNLYTEGDSSTKYQYAGTARVTGRPITVSKGEVHTIAFSVQGSGALTRSQIT